MMGLSTVVNVLPIRQLGVTLLYGDVPRPLLHPVENPLVNNRLKLPGKEDLPVASGLQLGPVLGEEIIGTAATPVHDVFVLTLAPLLPLPVGQVEVVVDVGHAEVGVTQHRVEERLRRQESVGEDRPETRDELVTGVDNIVGELFIETNPVRAAVNADPGGKSPGPQSPHVSLALEECLVQSLLLDKLLLLPAVTLHEVALPVVGEELHQLLLGLK